MTFSNKHLCGNLVLLYFLSFSINGEAAGAFEDTIWEGNLESEDTKTEYDFGNHAQIEVPFSKEGVQCPPPFFQVMFECFYVNVHHSLSWWEARSFCQDMGGDLAEPLHHGALLAVVADNYPDGPQHFWLGAIDLKQEGQFKWLNGREVYSGWRYGQPDNAEKGEHCLDLWSLKYPSFSDKDCSQARAFICQYK